MTVLVHGISTSPGHVRAVALRRCEARLVQGLERDERHSRRRACPSAGTGALLPGRSGKSVSDASERNPKLLRAFDRRGYWEVYERILRTSALRFPDNHRITGMSKGNGPVLFHVLGQSVSWLNPKRTVGVDRQSNTKPQLRGISSCTGPCRRVVECLTSAEAANTFTPPRRGIVC